MSYVGAAIALLPHTWLIQVAMATELMVLVLLKGLNLQDEEGSSCWYGPG